MATKKTTGDGTDPISSTTTPETAPATDTTTSGVAPFAVPGQSPADAANQAATPTTLDMADQPTEPNTVVSTERDMPAEPEKSATATKENPLRLPIVGEAVHYVIREGEHLLAAIHTVFAVPEGGKPSGEAELRVTDPSDPMGGFRASAVAYDESGAVGTWHFPHPDKPADDAAPESVPDGETK